MTCNVRLMVRVLWGLTGLSGFLGVAMGAFGAHGLKASFAASDNGPERLAWWTTASHYQLIHALALGLTALLASRMETSATLAAGVAFGIGTLLFSGSLYALALSNVRALGMVTPFGGVAFLIGWVLLAYAATR